MDKRKELINAIHGYSRAHALCERIISRNMKPSDSVIDEEAIALKKVNDLVDSIFPIKVELVIPKFAKFKQGDFVKKKSGSFWQGRVVGFYSTHQTPVGYCVQLLIDANDTEFMPVQIYPEQALEPWNPSASG